MSILLLLTALTAINGTLKSVNTDVDLQCQGVPPTDASNQIQWFRGDQKLYNSDKYAIVVQDANSTLTVHKSGNHYWYNYYS
jgi:hypothetical protein